MKKALIPLLLALSLLSACEEDAVSTAPPTAFNFRINDQLQPPNLHWHQTYQLSFGARDEGNIQSYQLTVENDRDGKQYSLIDNPISGRSVEVSENFIVNPNIPTGEHYQLILTVNNVDGQSKSLRSPVKMRDDAPILNISINQSNYEDLDTIFLSGSIRDRQDLSQFHISVHRDEQDMGNPLVAEFHLDFPASQDTLYTFGPNDYIKLPYMDRDFHYLLCTLGDTNGNGAYKKISFYAD